jgi:hypothetical protein
VCNYLSTAGECQINARSASAIINNRQQLPRSDLHKLCALWASGAAAYGFNWCGWEFLFRMKQMCVEIIWPGTKHRVTKGHAAHQESIKSDRDSGVCLLSRPKISLLLFSNDSRWMHVPKLERLIHQERHRTHLSAELTICITLSICNVGALSPAPAELLRRVHTTLCLSSEESESASRDIFRASCFE